MKDHKLTSEKYFEAIERGFYELIESVSDSKKTVKYYKPCGRVEMLSVSLEK